MTPLSTLGVEGVKMMGHLWVKTGRKDGQPGVIFHDGDLRIRNAISRERKRRSKFGTEDARSCLAAQLQLDGVLREVTREGQDVMVVRGVRLGFRETK